MNQEQLIGQLRTFLAVALATLAAKYLPASVTAMLPAEWAMMLAALLAGVPSALWSYYSKRPAAVAERAVAAVNKTGDTVLAYKVADALNAKAPKSAT